jgi:hypothetical protein
MAESSPTKPITWARGKTYQLAVQILSERFVELPPDDANIGNA